MSYGGTSTNRSKDVLNAWSPTNTSASIPALSLDDNNNEARMSTYYVEDGSYLKMKFIKLQYELPSHWLKCIGASALSVYGQMGMYSPLLIIQVSTQNSQWALMAHVWIMVLTHALVPLP